jgi:predicted nucleotidyltransferase component of viral defense system
VGSVGPPAVGTAERRAPVTSKAQITKIASRDGVDARVVERDYVLAHIVALISSYDADGRLIFKGGTSLRLLHFDAYRYSASRARRVPR